MRSDSAYNRRQGTVLGPQHFYKQRRQARANPDKQAIEPFAFAPGQKLNLAPIIKPENLVAVFDKLKHTGGQAPGLDGIRYSDLGRSEMWQAMRALSRAVKNGTYRPQPARVVEIAKKSGGTRELRLRVILDRVLAAAIYTAINPAIDPSFSPFSVGFRPGRDRLEIIAAIEQATRAGKWVIAEDDVNKAFDYVPVNRTVAAFGQHVRDPALLTVIEHILQGDNATRVIGIDQGSALSPLALNVLLDKALDRPMQISHPGHPLWRYADNLVGITESVTEAVDLLHTASQQLGQAGMTLKGHQPSDLRVPGTQACILGYMVSRSGNRLMYTVAPEGWMELEEQITGTWSHRQPSTEAMQVARGWLEGLGPCLCSGVDGYVARVVNILTRNGHQEIDPQALRDTAMTTRARWETIRDRTAIRLYGVPGTHIPMDSTAAPHASTTCLYMQAEAGP